MFIVLLAIVFIFSKFAVSDVKITSDSRGIALFLAPPLI